MFVVIMPLCNRMFCSIFGRYFYIEIRLKYEKIILLSSSRAFSLSTPMENSKLGKQCWLSALELFCCLPPLFCCLSLRKTVKLHGKKLQNATNTSISWDFNSRCLLVYPVWRMHLYVCISMFINSKNQTWV